MNDSSKTTSILARARREGAASRFNALRLRSSLSAQGARYVIAGSIVALVYLLTTTTLAAVAGLPFQVALAAGFSTGLCVHFSLQRLFVWAHHEDFALPIRRQLGRYLLVAGAQYGVTAASTALLPSVLGLPTEVVYLGTVVAVTSVNFLLFRNAVFHGKPMVGGPDATPLASLRE